ncbi:MAG: hypothetical protein R3305_10475 [Gammaproteobacteria bacterium]|nr:hypothetical protein [Gammaproteobacteria bacterium]
MSEAEIRDELAAAIDTIESGYEFLLAYAAQGRRTDRDAGADRSPRKRLEAMADAIGALPKLTQTVAAGAGNVLNDSAAFFDALERDAAVAAGAIRLVLAQQDIGSQLVDNLNASVHLRALLTDIFLIDESLAAKA